MAQEEVVIVDAAGTEHVFPAGFDPKKAAGIVKVQLGKAETAKADALRPQGLEAFTPSRLVEAGKQFGSMVAGAPEAILSGSERARDAFFGLPEAAKRITETPPHETVANMVRSAVTEPVRIGKQLGEGTPEALGKSVVDTAMYIPGILGAGRLATAPVKAGFNAAVPAVIKAAKSPVGQAALGLASDFIPGASARAIRTGMKAMQTPAASAVETPLLSPEADALRASTAVTGPETSVLDLQRARGGSPTQTPAVVDVPATARARKLMQADEASSRLRQASEMTPAPKPAPLSPLDEHLAAVGTNTNFGRFNPGQQSMMRQEGLPSELEAQLRDRADAETRAQMGSAGSRLTPKPAETPLPDFQVVEPEPSYGLNSPASQSSMSAGDADLINQLAARAKAAGPQGKPTASYVGRSMDEFPDMYNVEGGPSNGSSVSRATLDKMGIKVPGVTKVPMGASGPLHAEGVRPYMGKLTEIDQLQRQALMDELMNHYSQNTPY